jgi:hypothetical protein
MRGRDIFQVPTNKICIDKFQHGREIEPPTVRVYDN